MNEELNVLDELNKGAAMGKDSILYVLPKVEDKKFKKVLETQCKEYEKILKEIEKEYSKYSDKKPHDTSAMTKAMTWYGIQIRTFTDNSPSKIAELFLQGTNMGIIEGRRLLNNKNIPKKINTIISDFVDMQEKAVEELKEFL